MAASQLILLPVKEAVRCIRPECGCALATLDEMREATCADGGSHEVDRAEYFRLYRLSQAEGNE